jgi:hypothetical protein
MSYLPKQNIEPQNANFRGEQQPFITILFGYLWGLSSACFWMSPGPFRIQPSLGEPMKIIFEATMEFLHPITMGLCVQVLPFNLGDPVNLPHLPRDMAVTISQNFRR